MPRNLQPEIKLTSHAALPARTLVGGMILLGMAVIWLSGCESAPDPEPTAAAVAMPRPSNRLEAQFAGDIASALETAGWTPLAAAQERPTRHRVRFEILATVDGLRSDIELVGAGGRILARGTASVDTESGDMGEVALVFDRSLAAFQRSIADVPVPSAPAL